MHEESIVPILPDAIAIFIEPTGGAAAAVVKQYVFAVVTVNINPFVQIVRPVTVRIMLVMLEVLAPPCIRTAAPERGATAAASGPRLARRPPRRRGRSPRTRRGG
eukprot:4639317-Pyramimonas_sp.AAC.1